MFKGLKNCVFTISQKYDKIAHVRKNSRGGFHIRPPYSYEKYGF